MVKTRSGCVTTCAGPVRKKTASSCSRTALARQIQSFADTIPLKEKAALATLGVISQGHPQARISTGGRAPGDRNNYAATALQRFKAFCLDSSLDMNEVLESPQESYERIGRITGGTRTDFRYAKVRGGVAMRTRLAPACEAYLLGEGTLEDCT